PGESAQQGRGLKTSSMDGSFLWPAYVEVRRSAAELLMTPRVSWVVGRNFSGRSTGGQSGRDGLSFVLHAAGAPQIAHRAVLACLMLRHPSQTLSRSAVAEVCD